MSTSTEMLGDVDRLSDHSAKRWLPEFDQILAVLMFSMTAIMIVAPIGYLLYGSMRSESPMSADAYFTLQYWVQVYGTLTYAPAAINTMLLSGTVSALSVLIGAAMAWIVARTNAPGKNILASLLVVPLMISSLVTTIAWVALAAPNAGFINAASAALFGIKTVFNIYSFQGMALVLVLHYASFAFIPIYAALRSVDGSLEEASYMLGVSPMRTAVRMTIPLMWPAVATTFLIIFIFVAENFAVPTILGRSMGFETLASDILTAISVEPANPPLAATISTLLLWIAVVGTLWQRRISQNAARYVTIGGKGNRHLVADLGRWRFVATAVLCLYLFFAVALPYVALIAASLLKFITPRITTQLFTIENYARLLTSDFFYAIFNSILLSVGCGLAGTLLYTLLAYLIKRSAPNVGKAMDYIVVIPTVIPALVLGVGIMWTYVQLPLPIYGTIGILVVAYLTRFIGQGVRQSRAALVQISEELVEAARISGAQPLRAFKDVMVPLLKPSLISLWTVLFILIFMEISMTIVLYSPNSITIPVLLWSRSSGGFLPAACAIAVMQATIVFVVLFIADRLFGTLRTLRRQ